MKLKDIELTDKNHFVGMEYYYLIFNRTFLIIKTKGFLIGIQGNGLVSVEGGKDILTRQITSNMAIKGDLTNPYSPTGS
jgi:Ca2+-binding RTX toxin-like protein